MLGAGLGERRKAFDGRDGRFELRFLGRISCRAAERKVGDAQWLYRKILGKPSVPVARWVALWEATGAVHLTLGVFVKNSDTYNAANVIRGSERDGWSLGYVGIPWPGPWPKRTGDLFVTDPQGWQAGIAWQSSGPSIEQISGPSASRWGVFQVLFPSPVMSEQDLIDNFHLVLPLLKEQRRKVGSNEPS